MGNEGKHRTGIHAEKLKRKQAKKSRARILRAEKGRRFPKYPHPKVPDDEKMCKCGYLKKAHTYDEWTNKRQIEKVCKGFRKK